MRIEDPSGEWTLTEWEWLGLRRPINLADGHAHYTLSEPFLAALSETASLITELESIDQDTAERDLVTSFSRLSGQSIRPDEVCLHYSSSVSIEMCAKVIYERGLRTVGLITPTFDNIPLLLRRTGFHLVAIAEDELWASEGDLGNIPPCDAIFVVIPNNPTGRCPTAEQLLRLMQLCATSGRVLICDFSFRLYSNYHLWDQYEAARALPSLDFIFVEDTGKAYPLAEMKVGMAIASHALQNALRSITDELLLNTSPFVLSVLNSVIAVDLQLNGITADRQLEPEQIVRRNRRQLDESLSDAINSGVLACRPSRLSVAWLRLAAGSSSDICADWAAAGIVTLPGNPFFWDDPERGAPFIRVALARDPRQFADGMMALRELISRGLH